MRIFLLVFGLILMLPALGYVAWQGVKQLPGVSRVVEDVSSLGTYYEDAGKGAARMGALIAQSYEISRAMGAAAGDNDAMLGGALGVLSARARAAEVEMFAAPQEFHADREVRLEWPVRPEDLLDPGESLPDVDWLDIYMRARIVKLALEGCARLKEGIAAECRVADFSIERDTTAKGAVRYLPAELRVQITPKTPAGALPAPETAPEVTQDTLTLEEGAGEVTLSSAAYALAMRRAMQKAEAACAARRKRLGNCVIERLTVTASGQAHVSLASLVPTRAAPVPQAASN